MSNFRKFISVSAIAMLGATNLLTPLSYASATGYDALTDADLIGQDKAALRFEMPAHDVWLYAVTAPNTYTVDYQGHTHTSGTMSGKVFTYDSGDTLDPNAFQKTGYTFIKWTTEEDGSGSSFVDEDTVLNLTAVDNAHVPIYAQWGANSYSIDYDLNDGTGTSTAVHPGTPTSGAYDQELTIVNPTRTGYSFSGWHITNMGTGSSHTVGGQENYEGEEADGVMGTGYKNLRETEGTVHFAARWKADSNTRYDVQHFLQNLDGSYPALPKETDQLSGTTDELVTPDIHHYSGFIDATPYESGINADGSTVFVYKYPRDSFELTLIAGTGAKIVSGSSTYNTTGDSTSSETTISFKYDDLVTLSFEPKDGYENLAWTGYSGTASSFNMPAENISKTAYATAIVYDLIVHSRGGSGATDRTTYTVEDDDIPLGNPLTRDHSQFLGWTGGVNGEGITTPDKNAKVASGSTGDRQYSAVWSCVTGYHLELTGSDSESCEANTNTKYRVNHIQQDLSGNYTIYVDSGWEYGTTNEYTPLTGNNYEGFALDGDIDSYKEIINPDGSTVVDIHYKRLEYEGTIESMTGVANATALGDNSGESPFKYGDTVNLSATVESGYTWSNWTVEGSGTTTTVNNINGTFVMPANDVTITPHVTRDTYHIYYELYSGTVGVANPTEYTVESTGITLNEASRDHSQFLGWTGGVIDGKQLSGTTRPVVIPHGSVGDRKYYAVWSCDTGYTESDDGRSCEANTYTVTINYNDDDHPDSVEEPFTYDHTGTIANPSKSGYDFAGWTVSGYDSTATVDGQPLVPPTSGTKFNNLTTTSGGNVTLTATWTPKTTTEYKVFHYTNSLSGGYDLVNSGVFYGTSDAQLTVANLAREYVGFGSGVGYTGGTASGPDESTQVTTVTIDRHGTTEIHIYYDRESYHVYLSGDDGVASLTGAGIYTFGATVNVKATTKTGYHFVQWEKRGTGFAEL